MDKEIKSKEKINHRHFDKGEIFVKIMAGFLALLMVLATGATLIFALMG